MAEGVIKSVAFPKMFNHNHTLYVEDEEATFQNMKTVLETEQGEFKYDPFFGISSHKYAAINNELYDVFRNHIYTQLTYLIPQLDFSRNNINFETKRAQLTINIKAKNRINEVPNTYSFVLGGREETK